MKNFFKKIFGSKKNVQEKIPDKLYFKSNKHAFDYSLKYFNNGFGVGGMFTLALVKSNSKNKRMFEKEASNQKIKYEVTNFKIDDNNRGEILSTEGERHNPVDPKHKGPEIKNGDLVAVSDMSVSIHKKIFEGKTSTKPKFEIFGKLKPILNIKTNEFERDN